MDTFTKSFLVASIIIALFFILYVSSSGCTQNDINYINGYWEMPEVFMEQAKIKNGYIFNMLDDEASSHLMKMYLIMHLDDDTIVQNIYDIKFKSYTKSKSGVITAKVKINAPDLVGDDILPSKGELEIDIYHGIFRLFGPIMNTGDTSEKGSTLYLAAFKNNEVSCAFA